MATAGRHGQETARAVQSVAHGPVTNEENDLLQDSSHTPMQHGAVANLNLSNTTQTAGGNISNQIIVNEPISILHQLKSDLKPVGAAYNSATSSTSRRETCFEGTRVGILGEIEDWIHGRSPTRASIYVLDGVAGIGKSTIAQTIAERAAKGGILGASFFCSRDEDERNTGKHLFSTIAYQLACQSSEFRDRIVEVVKSDPSVGQKDFHVQFTVLLLDAIRSIPPSDELRKVIVIDALDECDQGDAKSILKLLGRHIPCLPHLRFFITSRPEFHITDILDHDTIHERFHLHDIEASIVQSDIRLYLDHSLSVEKITRAFPHLHPPWQPTGDEKQKLYGICGALFIIASTAIKFILDNKCESPKKQLAYLLDGVSPTDYSGSKRTDVLDRTYIRILLSAFSNRSSAGDGWQDQYQTVVGAIIVLQKPLPCRSLSELLRVSEDYVEGILLHLHSLVAPSQPDRIFRVHHKSFPDFITSRQRIQNALVRDRLSYDEAEAVASQLYIDASMRHRNITRQCFEFMRKNLKQNVGKLSPNDWFSNMTETEHLLDCCPISPAASYACLHWASHLSAAGLSAELRTCLWHWASQDALSWLEILSVINQIDTSLHILQKAALLVSLEETVTTQERGLSQIRTRSRKLRKFFSFRAKGGDSPGKGESELNTVLNDLSRFVGANTLLLRHSPMHVYGSGIPFTPTETSIYQLYHRKANIRLLLGSEKHWSPALAVLSGHADEVISAMFSPDSLRLASGSSDGTVRLWDPKSGAQISNLEGHSSGVTCIAFSPDGSLLASGSNDTTIRLWDAKSGSHLSVLADHSSGISCITYAPDGLLLASGSKDRTIRLWDGASGSLLSTLRSHAQEVQCIAFSSDGSRLASGSKDNTVQLWDRKSGFPLSVFRGHNDAVTCIAFAPDGSRLASGSNDFTVRLWDTESNRHLSTLQSHNDIITCIAFSPDSSRLASGSYDGIVWLSDSKSGSHLISLLGQNDAITCVAFSPDGTCLASGSNDCTVWLWDSTSGSHLSTLHGHTREVICISFSPDGTRLASGSKDNTMQLWDGDLESHLSTLHGHSRRVKYVAFSPDGSRAASASLDMTIRLWDAKSGSHLSTLSGQSSRRMLSVTFSPDGLRLASGTDSNSIRVWDAKSGALLHIFNGHTANVTCVAFSPKGSLLASGSRSPDKTVRFWHGKEGDHILTLRGHTNEINCIAFSPDGSQLASGSSDQTILLWDVKSGFPLRTLYGLHRGSKTISFYPDGSALVSVSEGNEIRLWDVESGSHVSFPYRHSVLECTFFVSSADSESSQTTTPGNHGRPSRFLLSVKQRQSPYLYGLAVSTDVDADGELQIVPICWFPPNVEPLKFAVNSQGTVVAVGCKNGRVFLLDISSVPLP